MDGRKALEVDLRTAPEVTPAPAPAPARRARELPVWLAVAAGVLGPALAELCLALEPAPAHPGAPEPVLAVVLGWATVGVWLAAAAAALARLPMALGWAVGGVALTAALVVACPSTGHHTLGGWWYGQMALCAGALVASAAALRWWSASRPTAAA